MLTIAHILVATDFSEPADSALTYGRHFARAFSATLHVVHVVNDLAAATPLTEVPVDLTTVQAQLDADARATLDSLLTDDDRQSLRLKPVIVTSPAPARAILEYADEARIDLIIAGTHGRGGLAEFFLGSVAQKIVRSAPCPVLTVRANEREFIRPDALSVPANSKPLGQ